MFKWKSITPLCLIGLVVVFLLVIAVQGQAQTKIPAKTLKIGATGPFFLKVGIQLKKVLELFAELTNKAGGISVKGQNYNIEYIVYDDKYDAIAGRAAGERLIFQDQVKFIAGPLGSAPALAMLEVTEPNKIPVFTSAATPKIYETKYKYVVHSVSMLARVTPDYMYWKEKRMIPPAAKTIVLACDDDATGHAMCSYDKECAEYAGYKVLDVIYYKRGITDFTPVATAVKALNPDIFHPVSLMAGGPLYNVMKAISQSGWRGTVIQVYAEDMIPMIVKEFGKDLAEGLIFNWADLSLIPNPPQGFLAFKEAYVKKYGTWEVDALDWCNGYYLLLEAIKKANSLDPDDVMAALAGLRYSWFRGSVQMFRRPDVGNNRYVDCSFDIFQGQVKDGKPIFAGLMTPEYQLDVLEKKLGQKIR
jgi:branched-chain amino acid transport system substrate-binding protein